MKPAPVALALAAALSAGLAASPKPQPAEDLEFVEIDVTVLDSKGHPVHGLKQADFSLKDDGKPVVIESFTEVTGPVPDDPDSARTVVLLLDDTGVAATGTPAIQQIARLFVASASKIDDVPIVRLHARDDEPYGDRISGEGRIQSYRGGAWPFAYWSTVTEALDRIADISRQVAANTSKRRVIVCVGSPFICNIQEPLYSAPRSFETAWTTAMTEAAKANVVVYGLIPGRTPFRTGGAPEFTGGDVLTSTYDMGPPIDRILAEASNYYVLGYWPDTSPRPLHRVDVKVSSRGAKVHARRVR
jgi:hypothetical protein